MKRIPFVFILALALCLPVFAQEESVNPGINDNFRDPDVNRYIKMFEGESRSIFANRREIVDALDLDPGMAVGDIGAGTGFFSLMISDRIGPDGQVYAVDIAENFIEHIKEVSKKHEKDNIEGIVCTDRSTELPEESIDVAFVCDTYHHFEFPYDTLASIHSALKPGGRLVIVDFIRIEGVSSDWVLGHVRCGMGAVIDEVQKAGFDFAAYKDLGMEDQYVIVFTKRDEDSETAED